MGTGVSSAYRPDYPTRDEETGEAYAVVWYPHRDAPSLIPWAMPSTCDPPVSRTQWTADMLALLVRRDGA